MARVESFTYGTEIVGGSTPTHTTQILSRFGWDFDAEDSDETTTFVAEFSVTGTSLADLNTQCGAVTSALRTKYQKLSIDWGASNVGTFDPAVAAGSGFNAVPKLRKLRNVASTGLTRSFEFRVRVEVPPNYNDANLSGNPACNGRRTSSVALHWDTFGRRLVTIDGTFTELATVSLPRGLTSTAQTNNPTGQIDTYCTARLAKVDTLSGAAAGTAWTLISRDEPDDNTQSVMSFRRVYAETINGRLRSLLSIGYLPSRQRIITITGAYVRTYASGVTTGAKAQYLDGTNGGAAFSVTQLAALTSGQGGALVPGQSCELISETAPPNEQDDRLDYTLVYRELLRQQSKNVAGGFDDPDVVVDSITYLLDPVALDDSPVPLGTPQSPNPFLPSPIGGNPNSAGGGKPSGTGAPQTLDKSVVAPTVPGPFASTTQSAPGTSVSKPADIWIQYKATIKKTVANPKQKWITDIRPWLIGQWTAELGFSPTYLVQDHFEADVASYTIAAVVHARVLPGDLLSYVMEDSVADDLALAFDKAFTGTPYEYLMQQLLPERKKIRTHKCVFKTGGSFDPSTLESASTIPGYVIFARTAPLIVTKITGVPALGIPTQSLTYVQFSEAMVWLGRAVAGSSSLTGATTPNGAPSGSSPTVATPTNPGGV